MGKVGFKLLADARKVSVNQVRFDVVTHVNSVEAECVHSGLYWEVVKADKG